MLHRASAVLAVAGLFLLSAFPGATNSRAQSSLPPLTVFRLGAESTFQRGCFDPCLCPVIQPLPVDGTLAMESLGFDGLFHQFTVSEVDWNVPDLDLTITGSGSYRVGGEFASEHQLSLDLRLGDEPVQHFDSSRVIGGSGFPVFDIVISVNQLYCYDTVFRLQVRPALQLAVDRESLSWGAVAQAPAYDVVAGDLGALQASNGDFLEATTQCVADDWSTTVLPEPQIPGPGEGRWYLIRFVRGLPGSYDSAARSQIESRDPEIFYSAAACP